MNGLGRAKGLACLEEGLIASTVHLRLQPPKSARARKSMFCSGKCFCSCSHLQLVVTLFARHLGEKGKENRKRGFPTMSESDTNITSRSQLGSLWNHLRRTSSKPREGGRDEIRLDSTQVRQSSERFKFKGFLNSPLDRFDILTTPFLL